MKNGGIEGSRRIPAECPPPLPASVPALAQAVIRFGEPLRRAGSIRLGRSPLRGAGIGDGMPPSPVSDAGGTAPPALTSPVPSNAVHSAAAAVNWSVSVDSRIAVVEDRPAEIAIATWSK